MHHIKTWHCKVDYTPPPSTHTHTHIAVPPIASEGPSSCDQVSCGNRWSLCRAGDCSQHTAFGTLSPCVFILPSLNWPIVISLTWVCVGLEGSWCGLGSGRYALSLSCVYWVLCSWTRDFLGSKRQDLFWFVRWCFVCEVRFSSGCQQIEVTIMIHKWCMNIFSKCYPGSCQISVVETLESLCSPAALWWPSVPARPSPCLCPGGLHVIWLQGRWLASTFPRTASPGQPVPDDGGDRAGLVTFGICLGRL